MLTLETHMKKVQKNYRLRADLVAKLAEAASVSGCDQTQILEDCLENGLAETLRNMRDRMNAAFIAVNSPAKECDKPGTGGKSLGSHLTEQSQVASGEIQSLLYSKRPPTRGPKR